MSQIPEMRSDQFSYDPALDDGGGGLSADLPGCSSREYGDLVYPGMCDSGRTSDVH
jgi:hypothetical protein